MNDEQPKPDPTTAAATGNYVGPLKADLEGELVGICHSCLHRRGSRICDAFPDGIPVEILIGRVDHRTPYPGDHGIQWEKGMYTL